MPDDDALEAEQVATTRARRSTRSVYAVTLDRIYDCQVILQGRHQVELRIRDPRRSGRWLRIGRLPRPPHLGLGPAIEDVEQWEVMFEKAADLLNAPNPNLGRK